MLRGLELHEYLKAKIAVPNTINDIPVPQGIPPNIEMNSILKQGYEQLQNLTARVVGANPSKEAYSCMCQTDQSNSISSQRSLSRNITSSRTHATFSVSSIWRKYVHGVANPRIEDG